MPFDIHEANTENEFKNRQDGQISNSQFANPLDFIGNEDLYIGKLQSIAR